jgi:tripartite-type tricarboxylate transporter receptor subunit TctC
VKIFLAAALWFFCALSYAQSLTIITLTAAGSLSDTALRQAAPEMERRLGRSILIKNMPGGDGLVGIQHILSLPEDGNTLLAGNSSIGGLEKTGRLTPDILVPVTGLIEADLFVYASTSSSYSSLDDLKSATHNLNAGSTSLMVEASIRFLDIKHGTRSEVIGYTQFGQALLDLAAGRLDYVVAPFGSSAVAGMVEGGKIRPIYKIGPAFTWSAFFARTGDVHRFPAEKIQSALAATSFQSIRRYVANGQDIRSRMKDEAPAMGATRKQELHK